MTTATLSDDRRVITEQQLVDEAKAAMSVCNWTIGRCAATWTQRYAKGRTDAAFGDLLGLSADQVYQRRRVWDTFADVREQYSRLSWSHFAVALTWEDAADCLGWAEEMEATVSEMRAWRRAQHGEDLSVDSEETHELASTIDAREQLRQAPARATQNAEAPADSRSSRDSGPVTMEDVTPPAREKTERPYSPYGTGARSTTQDSRPEPGEKVSEADRIGLRIAHTLEKCVLALGDDLLSRCSDGVMDRLSRAVGELTGKIQQE